MIPERWRPWLSGGLIVAGLAALCLWIVSKTEWVDVDVPRAPVGEAASDDLYVLKRILGTIRASTVIRDDLSQLPPPGATLLLSGWNWDLLPEQNKALRAWVGQGGHLVIEIDVRSAHPTDSASWIPIERVRSNSAETPPAVAPAERSDDSVRNRAPGEAQNKGCRKVAEPEGIAPAYRGDGGADGLSLCIFGGAPLSTRQAPLWALDSQNGTELLRVGYGSGSVTGVRGWGAGRFGNDSLFGNSRILIGDNALIAVAALQARRGADVWLLSGHGGQALLVWLWSRAWVALVLALLALCLWLWRASMRFGPIEASPPLARRSMSEQISGTAAFLWHRDPEALHMAQVRALDEAAALRVRQYARLDRIDRAAAIAAAAGIGAGTVATALAPAAVRGARALPGVLVALETARRRLLEPARTPPAASSRRADQANTQEASR